MKAHQQFSVLSSQFSVNPLEGYFSAGTLGFLLRTENWQLRTSFVPTRPRQWPLPPDWQLPAATKTSSQTTSVGHSGSAATCPAPIYKERETRKSSRQTRTPAAAPAATEAQTAAHSIPRKTAAWLRKPP